MFKSILKTVFLYILCLTIVLCFVIAPYVFLMSLLTSKISNDGVRDLVDVILFGVLVVLVNKISKRLFPYILYSKKERKADKASEDCGKEDA